MANTKLSQVTTHTVDLSGGSPRLTAIADGTAKPGDAVGIDASGNAIQTDIGASEMFDGFLEIDPILGADTAITANKPCVIVVPVSGKLYAHKVVDQGGAKARGLPLGFSATAGAMDDVANYNTAGAHSKLETALVDDDVYCKSRWL